MRLEQMITNLIDNPFKYTPEGGAVDISVQAKLGDDLFRGKTHAAHRMVPILGRILTQPGLKSASRVSSRLKAPFWVILGRFALAVEPSQR